MAIADRAALAEDARPGEQRVFHPGVDFAVALGLLPLIIFFSYRFLSFRLAPYEDAAILMRYAQHIAEGYGIVWNIGAKPVDGGTDFLPMLLMAALIKLGLTASGAARLIGIVSHLATSLIIYLAVRRYGAMPISVCILCAAFFFVGPGLLLVSAAFTTPMFVMLAALTWYFALEIILSRQRVLIETLFAFSALATGLARPEGVFLSGFMVLAIMYAKGIRPSLRLVTIFVSVFAVLGGAYFIWRWHYFGQPLPNPYYKKGGFALYPRTLLKSVFHVCELCWPTLPAFILGLRKYETRKLVIATAIPIVLFTLIWVLLSDEMNYMMRFQLAVFPIALMSWPLFIRGLGSELKLTVSAFDRPMRRTITLLAVAGAAFAFAIMYRIEQRGMAPGNDNRYAVAQALSGYDHHYVIASTEAGLLPFYSQWISLDTWGLNDQWIAHHGTITLEYLNRWQPEVIALHEQVVHRAWSYSNWEPWFKNWDAMLSVVNRYAKLKHYILAAAIGSSPFDVMVYYVKPGNVDSAAIVSSIKAAAAQNAARNSEVDFASWQPVTASSQAAALDSPPR